MKWWKPLLIFLLCATPSWAGFWSDFPGVGPGTVLNDVIIDNSTINSSTLNQPIINDPTFNGTSTYNPGTVINYDPSTIINGPDGSIWYYNGIDNLKNLTIAVGGSITLPPGSTLNLPDGSVWTDQGLSTLNIQAGGVITIGGIPAGGACPANQFYIALSSSLVPTCAPVTNIPGPVTINQATFTGNTTMPDGSIWSVGGISKSTPLNFATTINISGTGALTFNGTPVGGTCPADQWVYAISPTLQPVCSTPTGGGGGGTIPTPVSVANGGLGQGAAPSVGQILVANGPTSYVPVTMTGDATINSAGQITVNSVNGQTVPFQLLTSTSVTAPTNPVDGQFWFDPTTLQTYIWYTDPTSSQWVAVVNLTGTTLNSPILNNATFTGTVTFPNGSIADSALAGAYSGIGACGTGLFVTALNRNAPPTCSPAGVIVSATPPASPVDSQLWFNSTDLQTYLRYNDGSSTQWVPVVNLSGATLNNPILTNPTFVGTLQFPDGSYYDTNGHEIMKNLGVGIVARSDGVNGTYGNSLTVAGSGWGSAGTVGADGYWDSAGIEQTYGVFAATLYSPAPRGTDVNSGAANPEVAVETDPNNAALDYPFGEYFFQNRSTPRPPADQTWQAEGIQWINGIAIHDDTWDSAAGCTSASPAFWLGNCAVVAFPDSNYNDINYKMVVGNLATTAHAQASYNLLTNGAYVTELTAFGPNYATVPAWANSAAVDTSAPNGLRVGTSAGTGPVNIEVGGNILANFNGSGFPLTIGSATQAADLLTGGTNPLGTTQVTSFVGIGTKGPQIQLIGPNSSVAETDLGSIMWGSPGNPPGTPTGTPPSSAGKVAALIQATAGGGNVEPSAGLQFATALGDGTTAKVTMELARDGTLVLPTYAQAGGFLGGPGTVNVSNGYFINGARLVTSQVSFSPAIAGQVNGSCTATSSNQGFGSRVGNHVIVQMSFVGTCTASGGWLQIAGFPWRNTGNTLASCALEVGGMPFDTNYWMATCRMLPGWDGCIPVEVNSNAAATYYNAGLLVPGQQISINMTCSYLVDSMSP